LHHVEQFATDEEMDLIMKTAFPKLQPQDQEAETGIVHELPVGDNPLFEKVYDRMSALFPGVAVRTPREEKLRETFRVRRYLPDGVAYKGGDFHPAHTDWFEANGKGDLTNVLIITMIVYLTTPEEGGSTYFPKAIVNGKKGYHFKAKRGDLAVWWSCHKNGTQDFTSEHESIPLKQGIKWNAARFFYDNVKKCNTPASKTVKVPKAADNNVPMTNSSAVMFGTSFPPGVSTSPKGTITNETVHGGFDYGANDDAEFKDEDFKDEDADAASDGDNSFLAKEIAMKEADKEKEDL